MKLSYLITLLQSKYTMAGLSGVVFTLVFLRPIIKERCDEVVAEEKKEIKKFFV